MKRRYIIVRVYNRNDRLYVRKLDDGRWTWTRYLSKAAEWSAKRAAQTFRRVDVAAVTTGPDMNSIFVVTYAGERAHQPVQG